MLLVFAAAMLSSAAPGVELASAAPTLKPEKEKKICRLVDGRTGSRMRIRVCRTNAEWLSAIPGDDEGELNTLNREARTPTPKPM